MVVFKIKWNFQVSLSLKMKNYGKIKIFSLEIRKKNVFVEFHINMVMFGKPVAILIASLT